MKHIRFIVLNYFEWSMCETSVGYQGIIFVCYSNIELKRVYKEINNILEQEREYNMFT